MNDEMAEDVQTAPEFLNDDWIEAHNKRVAAFRKEHFPRIHALTDEECKRVYARWTDPTVDMAANRLALEFRDEFGMTWPQDHAIGVGIELIQTVLVRLDKYDPDFRPRPEPMEMGQIGEAQLWYLPAEGKFRVELGDVSEEFRAIHSPKFGVDIDDMAIAEEVVGRLTALIRPVP